MDYSRSGLAVLFIIAFSANVGDARAEQPLDRQHAVLMEKKLTSAQEVLGGLARRNFPEIEKQAQMLNLLSHEAAWNVIQTEEYLRLSDSFRSTIKQLKRAAEDGESDAVALAYINLTISCIDCHRYAEAQRAARDGAEESSARAKETQ